MLLPRFVLPRFVTEALDPRFVCGADPLGVDAVVAGIAEDVLCLDVEEAASTVISAERIES